MRDRSFNKMIELLETVSNQSVQVAKPLITTKSEVTKAVERITNIQKSVSLISENANAPEWLQSKFVLINKQLTEIEAELAKIS